MARVTTTCSKTLLLLTTIFLAYASTLKAQRGAITLPRNLLQMTELASTIVHGRVTYAHVERHPQFRNLNTVLVTITVVEALKGTAGRTLTYRQFIWDPRDAIDRAGYAPGQELVLFLNPETSAGLTSPVGITQGRFRVYRSRSGETLVANGDNNSVLFQGLRNWKGAARVSRAARQALARGEAQPGPLSLSVLKEIVREAAPEAGP